MAREEPVLDRATTEAPAAQIVALLMGVLSQARAVDAATALATELATAFRCDRVSIGFAGQRQAEVVAFSYGLEFNEQQAVVQAIASAMDECMDQGRTVVFPPPTDSKPSITRLHAHLSRQHRNASICSVPFARLGKLSGVIIFERASAQGLDAETVHVLEHVASTIGPVLDLQRVPEQPLWDLLGERVRKLSKLDGAFSTTKVGALGALALMCAAALVPAEYRVSAPARLEGSVQRMLVAPSEAFLKEVHARPGDVVKQGQVLAELAQESFALERRKWQSEIAQQENAYRDAVAKHDRLGVVTAQSRIDEARAQLALADDKLGRTQIVAPFDGVIIKGDLSQSLGAPVKQGDFLLTIAPRDDYRVMIEVDERDIADISAEHGGSLALAANPGETLPIRVARVTPVAASADGRNYFEVEAKLEANAEALRPGLKGVAKIDAGRRSLLWIWGHRALDALRLATWSWLN